MSNQEAKEPAEGKSLLLFPEIELEFPVAVFVPGHAAELKSSHFRQTALQPDGNESAALLRIGCGKNRLHGSDFLNLSLPVLNNLTGLVLLSRG